MVGFSALTGGPTPPPHPPSDAQVRQAMDRMVAQNWEPQWGAPKRPAALAIGAPPQKGSDHGKAGDANTSGAALVAPVRGRVPYRGEASEAHTAGDPLVALV